MCPPVNLLAAAADEIRRRPCSGVILVPNWPTSYFYGKFFDGNGVKRPFVLVEMIFPYIYQNQRATGPLNGKTKFNFFVLAFNTILENYFISLFFGSYHYFSGHTLTLRWLAIYVEPHGTRVYPSTGSLNGGVVYAHVGAMGSDPASVRVFTVMTADIPE